MYASAPKIYPREVSGRFARLRVAAVWLLLGLFYAVPWLRWEGRQAVLFDLPARQFHIFGLTFWPQEFLFMAWLLVLAALALFFVTAVAGRLWCGYACPQTVWTEAFIWMERLAEGPRQRRIKLDRAPWNAEKVLRKSAKHLMWVLFALFTGYTFVGYFTPVDVLAGRLLTFGAGPWETFWVGFYAFATWGNAGFLREQVCLYMCPYARFQSAMFDRDTLIISYDLERGEPRGKRARAASRTGLGDCVDCTLCVQACPTGIDIREGLQYECIACAACIDACDSVMDRMGYDRGLIRYATQRSMDGGESRVLRPRTVIYGVLLLLLAAAFVAAIALRSPLELEVLRDRNMLYQEIAGGRIENSYTVRLVNKRQQPVEIELRATGLPGIELSGAGPVIELGPGELRALGVRISAPAGAAPGGGHEVTVEAAVPGESQVILGRRTRFFLPAN
ncbi:MAG: cytochrome c oxidase accessory protein CcoG [Chromatiales bacterium]|nr:cytochrome c oxidase accessory protein CcoG [Chromatiales bacterium]